MEEIASSGRQLPVLRTTQFVRGRQGARQKNELSISFLLCHFFSQLKCLGLKLRGCQRPSQLPAHDLAVHGIRAKTGRTSFLMGVNAGT
jgi:hypothetical protein